MVAKMKQYNLAFYDKENKKPCTYIIEHNAELFEGFFFNHSIGMFDNVETAAKMLWYRTELTAWEPAPEQQKNPN